VSLGPAQRLSESPAVLWAVGAASAMSVFSLAVLLLTIVVGVTARYGFSSPLLGTNEIMQLSLVALVSMALLPSAHADLHIRVDVLDARIGRYGRWLGDLFTRWVCAAMLFVLVYRGVLQALDTHEFEEATNMLAIPLWPFYVLLVLGAGLHGLVLLVQSRDLLRRGASDDV
jgi:TRAP-type C4-dicarboxylate transport system permease small subunit